MDDIGITSLSQPHLETLSHVSEAASTIAPAANNEEAGGGDEGGGISGKGGIKFKLLTPDAKQRLRQDANYTPTGSRAKYGDESQLNQGSAGTPSSASFIPTARTGRGSMRAAIGNPAVMAGIDSANQPEIPAATNQPASQVTLGYESAGVNHAPQANNLVYVQPLPGGQQGSGIATQSPKAETATTPANRYNTLRV